MSEETAAEDGQIVSARQRAKMDKFFSGFSGQERRRLRQAAARVSGKKEGIAAMMSRQQFAPAAPPDPTPKLNDDDRGEGRTGD